MRTIDVSCRMSVLQLSKVHSLQLSATSLRTQCLSYIMLVRSSKLKMQHFTCSNRRFWPCANCKVNAAARKLATSCNSCGNRSASPLRIGVLAQKLKSLPGSRQKIFLPFSTKHLILQGPAMQMTTGKQSAQPAYSPSGSANQIHSTIISCFLQAIQRV